MTVPKLLQAVRTPTWLSRIVFMVGAVTIVSALSPAARDRTAIISTLVPGVFPAAATTGAAAVGVILVALSRALRRGKYRAWLLATALTALTVLLHLLKGLDVEEATLSVILLLLLVTSHRMFNAKPDPRSLGRLLTVLGTGPLIAAALGFLWLMVDRDGQLPGTTTTSRITESLLGLVGLSGPVQFIDAADSERAAVALAVLGASVLLVAILVALQPANGPHALSAKEEARLRGLLERWGDDDSLAYFALRSDRSVMFSPSGKSAITYRVVGTVSLAAGDPLGDPEAWPGAIAAWLAEARSFGWVPGVLAASERGAEAFHRAGLDAWEFGDEAVVDLANFSLRGRTMRSVRQAVSRCQRAGLGVDCRRVADLTEEERLEALDRAVAWRDGPVERGYSMALGRLADPRDPRAVLVRSRDADGHLRGLLHFVPWGTDGLSLDVMRRDRAAENGIVEHMVAGLAAEAGALGISRLSLNFAVFRSVFARGERLGAGPVLRLWRSILLALSRHWQMESLYRANAKYRPRWMPRFVCFQAAADLPRIGVAALRAEAFIVVPRSRQVGPDHHHRLVVRRAGEQPDGVGGPGAEHVVDLPAGAERAGIALAALPRGCQAGELEAVEVGVTHRVDRVAERQLLSDDSVEAPDLAPMVCDKPRAV